MKRARTEARRKYERERKRRLMLDPVYRATKNLTDRNRLKDPEKRKRKNDQQRARLAANKEQRDRANARRLELTRKQQSDPEWRERFRQWQNAYFRRHYGDEAFRQRRDLHRVKSYYGFDDPLMIEALAMVRAFKRKVSKRKASA